MKTLTLILLLLLPFISNSQTIEETATLFWEAVNTSNNEIIIEKGEILIKYIDDNHFELDSSIAKVRIYTARALSGSLTEYSRALMLNLQTLESCQKKWGTHHGYSTVVINNIAKNYSSLGNHKKALEFNLKALAGRKKALGKNHSDYAMSLSNVARNYSGLKEYKKALEFNLEALALREKVLGKNHSHYAFNLGDISQNYKSLRDYNKALEFNLEALDILEKTLGKKNPNYFRSLSNAASICNSLGDYSKALEFNLKTLKLRENALGKEHPDYINSLNNTALNYQYLGNYIEALELNLKALKLRENAFGKEHPDCLTSLSNTALNYQYLGDYNKALKLNLKALKLRENAFGKESPDYANSSNNIAGNYSSLGDYNKSLEYNIIALEIYEKTLGKEHPNYAMSLSSLAQNYFSLGDYNKAIEYNLIALKIREKALGKEHPSYANNLNNIATNFSGLGGYGKSLEFNLLALEIYEKTLGKEHPSYAMSLNNIAGNYSNLGDHNKALELNLLTLDIREKALGKEHPDYAMSLNNIASDYSKLGNYNKSLEYNLKALEIYEKTLGKEHPNYALSMNNIASNYFNLGDYKKALEFNLLATRISMRSFTKNKFGLTPALQVSLKKEIELDYQFLASLSCIDDSAISDVYNIWIELNGIIGSDQNRFKEEVQSSKDSSLIQLFDELKLSQSQLVKYNEMTFQERKQKGIDTKALEGHITELESELSKRSQGFAEMNRSFSSKDAEKHLNDDEVLIDIVRFPYYDHINNEMSDSVKYLVFISNSKDTVVDYLYIDGGKKLEEELFANYSSYAFGSNKTSEIKDELSYNYFWKPIADKIGDKTTVYISLSGIYNNINLNTLYNTESNNYLFEEKDIQIVNSTRDFILSKEREKKEYTNTTAALFGYPNYDGNAAAISDSNDYLAISRDLNTFWIDSLNRGGMIANPLPGTKTEVENITLTFKEKNWNVSTFIGDSASETAVKQIKSPRVVHIATHGYFFDDIPKDTSETRFMGIDKQQLVQDPLLRSGLLFTGANKTLQGEETKRDNGLLSAAEASLLDLRETELVVLSACETGRGEVKNSEGVYGLRKAMSDAGAANTIMSLWKVDDKVTQEFMSTFYSTWLSGKTIRVAFNKTQLTIKEKYPQPYYWGAFVLVGK